MKNDSRQQFVIFHNEEELLDVKKDIYLLHRHLDLVKNQIEREHEKVREMKKDKVEVNEDGKIEEFMRSTEEYIEKEQERWVQNGVPQIVVNPFIVSTWSLYESVIKDFASILQRAENIQKSIYEAKGRYFVERAKKISIKH